MFFFFVSVVSYVLFTPFLLKIMFLFTSKPPSSNRSIPFHQPSSVFQPSPFFAYWQLLEATAELLSYLEVSALQIHPEDVEEAATGEETHVSTMFLLNTYILYVYI